MSLPHWVQKEAPAPEKYPAEQAVWVWLPSQLLPATHALHAERVCEVPPLVKDPAAQRVHWLLPVPVLYIVSELQSVHVDAPIAA